MPRTTYQFTTFNKGSGLTAYAGHNRLYVEEFVRAMNERDYVQHKTEIGREPETHGWSFGRAPRYFDGRVTTRRTSWVYAKVEGNMPEGACAAVYFHGGQLVGYLVKVAPGTPVVNEADVRGYVETLTKIAAIMRG